MKKHITLILILLLNAIALSAQDTDSVTMNSGYSMDVFYQLENGTTQTVAGAEWTVALSTGAQTSSIYINDGRGVVLYETTEDIANFATLDTTGLVAWTKSYNEYNDWEHSAFEMNATGHPNYGWGEYNSVSHIVVGNKVFVIKTLGGLFYKTMVVKKEAGAWHYRYATLDNSFDTTIVYQASDLNDRNFAYLNMDNHMIANREPENTNWDILFTKYYDTDEAYLVTGALLNKGVTAVEIDGVLPSAATYVGETFETTTKIIGSDWKTFNMTTFAYDLDSNRTFFVKQLDGDIYKIHFTRFDGSSNGKIVFNKELVLNSAINTLENIAQVVLYPNPATDNINLITDATQAVALNYTIYNVLGNALSQNTLNTSAGFQNHTIDVSQLTAGIYFLQLNQGKQKQTIKFSITK
jgi:hypothetical protein